MAGETIYFIEDEKDFRDLVMVPLLKKKGYNAVGFPTVDAALAHMGWSADSPSLKQNIPTAILTDHNTKSARDGFDVLKAAKGADIPCFLLSATEGITQAQVFAAGGPRARFYEKPIMNLAGLIEDLGKALDGRGR